MQIEKKVYFIGAGPGDPELLTLKGKKYLERADVVLFDVHVHGNLLHLCAPHSPLIPTHNKSCLALAVYMQRQVSLGHSVVRLLSGDGWLDGRCVKECSLLKERDIAYEVIPGVSQEIAFPAYEGISLQGEKIFDCILFLEESALFCMAPSSSLATTFMLRIKKKSPQAVIKRIAFLSPRHLRLPAMLLCESTTSARRMLTGTLGELQEHQMVDDCEQALLLVGTRFSAPAACRWRDSLPLIGQRIILLRTIAQAQELTAELSSLGADVVQWPLLTIIPRKTALQRITPAFLAPFTGLIFTSANGVALFMRALFAWGDVRALYKKKVLAIGSKTKEMLQQHGIIADAMPEKFVAEGLLDILGQDLKEENILIPTAQDARALLPSALRHRGARVCELKLYKTMRAKAKRISIEDGNIVVFTSPSTAHYFFSNPAYTGQKIIACCIGEITTSAVKKYRQCDVLTSSQASTQSISQCILEYVIWWKKWV